MPGFSAADFHTAVGIRAMRWAPAEGGADSAPLPPGRAVSGLGPNLRRYLEAQLDPARYVTRFGGPPISSSWATSETQWAGIVAKMRDVALQLSLLGDAPGAQTELDVARKFTYQVGGKWGYFYEPAGFVAPREVGADLGPAIRVLRSVYGIGPATLGLRPPRRSYPRTKMGGQPHFKKGAASFLHDVVAACHLRDADDLPTMLGSFASVWGGGSELMSVVTGRSKPTRKTLPVYDVTPSGPLLLGHGTSMFPDTRIAMAMSRFFNIRGNRAAGRLKSVAFRRAMSRPLHPAVLARNYGRFVDTGRFGTPFAEDMSAYDRHVRAGLQSAIMDGLYTFMMDPADRGLWRANWDARVVTPPLCGLPSGGPADGYSYDRVGMTSSGHIGTSVDGVWINSVRLVACMMHAMRWTERQAADKLGSEWMYWVWGDDTLVLPPKHFDFDRYSWFNENMVHFESRSIPDPVLLMRWYHRDPAGRWVGSPLACRVAQNTFAGEYAPASVAHEHLALVARTWGVELNPYWRLVEPIIFDGSGPTRHYRTLAALRAGVADPYVAAALVEHRDASIRMLSDLMAREDRDPSVESVIAVLVRALGQDVEVRDSSVLINAVPDVAASLSGAQRSRSWSRLMRFSAKMEAGLATKSECNAFVEGTARDFGITTAHMPKPRG